MRPKRIVGIQARLGSTRLPRKVLADLCGKSMLRRVWEAVQGDWTTIVLIPNTEGDDELARYCRSEGMDYLRGPERNVLGRYEFVACTYRPERLIRVCADAPFLRREWIEAGMESDPPVFAPSLFHGGSWRDWLSCVGAIKADEDAGHDWFAARSQMLDLVPESYLMVNTPDDLEAARRILADRSL